MVRTKNDSCGKKAAGAKAPRKVVISPGAGSSSGSGSLGKSDKYSGGNPYCPRPTPSWQKEISHFLIPSNDQNSIKLEPTQDDICSGSSSSSTSDLGDKQSEEPSTSASAGMTSHFVKNRIVSDDED